MKGINLFCSSPASTAICSSLDHRSVVRSIARPNIDRHTSKHYFEKSRRSTSSVKPSDLHRKSSVDGASREMSIKQSDQLRRKSSADISDVYRLHGYGRYLQGDKDKQFIDWISESDNAATPLIHSQVSNLRLKGSNDDSPALRRSSSLSLSHEQQVVVLKMSIHCKGCEGKVKKHISKMEGVTSFSIDLAMKKVTVIGNVTPLGVLASLSKVKNAQLWPSPASITPFPATSPRWST